ncbi:hypothetical protein C6P44_002465 [Monosporozyma unispora]|nr:hypothetical protein C6P44_002465 [Kazachstania unispora]
MSFSNKEVATAIVDFLVKIIDKKEVSDDNIDSLNVAIDCITDVFDFDRDAVKSVIEAKFNGDNLKQILTKLANETACETSGEDVIVNIPKEDAEIKAKAEALKLEGNKAIAQKDFNLAIKKYTEAINVLPTNAVYYANRAAAYTNLQKYDEAIKDAEAAIKIDPDYSKGYSRLAYAKYVQDKPEEALEAYKRVLEIEGDNATDVMRRGYETAKKRVEESLNQDDNTTDVERTKPASEAPGSNTEATPDFSSMFGNSGAGGMPDLASMLGGGLGGGLGSLLNNPQMMQAAQSMMQDPNTMQKMQAMMQNPAMQQMAQNFASGNTSMDDLMSNPDVQNMASNLFGGPAAGSDSNGDKK